MNESTEEARIMASQVTVPIMEKAALLAEAAHETSHFTCIGTLITYNRNRKVEKKQKIFQ